MLRLLSAGVRHASRRSAGEGVKLSSAGRRKLGATAAVAALGGAAAAAGLGSPAQAQESSWRFTAPAAEERVKELEKKTKSEQAGFNLPPIVVTISGAAGQIGYSERLPHPVAARPPDVCCQMLRTHAGTVPVPVP